MEWNVKFRNRTNYIECDSASSAHLYDQITHYLCRVAEVIGHVQAPFMWGVGRVLPIDCFIRMHISVYCSKAAAIN